MTGLTWILLGLCVAAEIAVACDEKDGYVSGRRTGTRILGYVQGFVVYALIAVILI